MSYSNAILAHQRRPSVLNSSQNSSHNSDVTEQSYLLSSSAASGCYQHIDIYCPLVA